MIQRIHGALFFVLFGTFCGCGSISVKHTSLSDGSTPKIRAVQISDLHYDSSENKFVEMVDKINKIDPDLLLITGDFLSKKTQLEPLIRCLSRLKATCPKYAVLGNWEYWSKIDIDTFKTRLSDIGISLLVNEGTTLNLRNRAVQIYGLDDYLGGKPNFGDFKSLDGHLNIVLAHCPILFDALARSGGANNRNGTYMLSGHTHGGQITFFGWPMKTPVGSGPYSSGVYQKGADLLHVNRGIGNSVVNFRLFSPPTIDLLEM